MATEPPAAGRYPRIWYEMLFIGFSLILGMSLSGAFLAIFAKELDPSGSLVGYVVSAWFLARVFIELPSGFISDRVGRRRLFVLGIALSAVGAFLCATAPAIHFLIAGRAVWGFGAALFFLNNTAILLDLFDPAIRGRAVGTFNGVQFAGSLAGAPIGAFLAELLGCNAVFFVTVALTGVSLLLAVLSRDLKRVERGAPRRVQPFTWDALRVLWRWEILAISIAVFARMFVMNGVMSTIFQLYLHDHLGFDVSRIGLVSGARTAGFIAATFASGFLSDRVGRKPLIGVGLLVNAACTIAFTLVDALWLILILGLVDGVGAGSASTTLTVLLAEIVDTEYRGASIGLYRTFMDVGGILGPIVFVALASALGLVAPFQVGAATIAAAALIIATIRSSLP
jgi:MFS family permease